MSRSSGDYAKWLNKVQSGNDNARALLISKLTGSDKTVSPADAAIEVMKQQLDVIKSDTQKFFNALINHIRTNEEAMAASPTGAELHSPTSTALTTELQNLSLANAANQERSMEIAHELLTRDPTLQKDLALCIRGKLWEDTHTDPKAGPKELAETYKKNLEALAQEAGSELTNQLRLDLKAAPGADPSTKKSMADTFTELADAAEKLDPNTAIEKLEAKIAELTEASNLIVSDFKNLTKKLDPADTDYEKDPAKRAGLEIDLEKLRNAQDDLVKKSDALEENRGTLKTTIGKGANPEKNLNLTNEVIQANAAISKIEREAPLADRATQGKTSKLDDLKKIGIGDADHKSVLDAYKDSNSTGKLLRLFEERVNALNTATEALRDLSKKLVTPDAMKAYELQYQSAVRKVDTCCDAVAAQLNEQANRDLIEMAYSSQGKKGALKDITTDLKNLNEAATDLRREFDGSHGPKAVSRAAGKERPAIEPLGGEDSSIRMIAEKLGLKNRKEDAEALQKYYTFYRLDFDKNTGKYNPVVIKDSSGNEINLSFEEMKALVAEWNATHPKHEQIDPPTKRGANGHHTECHRNSIRERFINEMMIPFQDAKNAAQKAEHAVAESEAAKGPETKKLEVEKLEVKELEAKKFTADATGEVTGATAEEKAPTPEATKPPTAPGSSS